MKIVICGSMSFAKEMLEAAKVLEKMGHEPILPLSTEACLENPNLNIDPEYCVETDIIRDHFEKIERGDAILVINHEKNGIEGYIGGSTLMEIGLAYHLGKKIFLLNKIPDLRYGFEIELMKPTILNGKLEEII